MTEFSIHSRDDIWINLFLSFLYGKFNNQVLLLLSKNHLITFENILWPKYIFKCNSIFYVWIISRQLYDIFLLCTHYLVGPALICIQCPAWCDRNWYTVVGVIGVSLCCMLDMYCFPLDVSQGNFYKLK